MQDAIKYVTENAESLITAALAVVGAASAIASIFGKQDNKWLNYLRKGVNYLAMNFGKAKNKE